MEQISKPPEYSVLINGGIRIWVNRVEDGMTDLTYALINEQGQVIVKWETCNIRAGDSVVLEGVTATVKATVK